VNNDSKLQIFFSLQNYVKYSQGQKNQRHIYHLIDRLIRLVLTLPVFTTTIERAFSIMKVVKTRLRNKMDDEFLANNLVVYIEREIVESFNLDSILDDFVSLRGRKLDFQTLYIYVFFVLVPTCFIANILILANIYELL